MHARPLAADLIQRGYVVAVPEYRRTGGLGGWPQTGARRGGRAGGDARTDRRGRSGPDRPRRAGVLAGTLRGRTPRAVGRPSRRPERVRRIVALAPVTDLPRGRPPQPRRRRRPGPARWRPRRRTGALCRRRSPCCVDIRESGGGRSSMAPRTCRCRSRMSRTAAARHAADRLRRARRRRPLRPDRPAEQPCGTAVVIACRHGVVAVSSLLVALSRHHSRSRAGTSDDKGVHGLLEVLDLAGPPR